MHTLLVVPNQYLQRLRVGLVVGLCVLTSVILYLTVLLIQDSIYGTYHTYYTYGLVGGVSTRFVVGGGLLRLDRSVRCGSSSEICSLVL